MATPITSFWFAIYKRLWGFAHPDDAHTADTAAGDGNFSLEYSGKPNGIFGTTNYGNPIKLGTYVAAENPLWAILNAPYQTPAPQPPDYLVTVQGTPVQWPAMPWPAYAPYPVWDKFNDPANPPMLIDYLKHWIEVDHQIDDTPKGNSYLDYWGFLELGSPPYPLGPAPNNQAQILYVASWAGDDGQRPGNIPATWWDSSLIFVTGQDGTDQGLPTFKPGEEHYIAAVIGNAGNLISGSIEGPTTAPQMLLSCSAYVFSTFQSPGTALPSLHNLSVTDTNTSYEQWYFPKLFRDVVGFRFNVDAVYSTLYNIMKGFSAAQLGNLSPDTWLKQGHACVKVWITSGEYPSVYNAQGSDWPDGSQSPHDNRKIAQRNLAGFDPSVVAMKKVHWQLFVMSQAHTGANGLTIRSAMPLEAVRYFLAVPTVMYERYVAKGGSTRGFEVVRDVAARDRPMPECVILRQTSPGATLHIAEHRADRFFGMALGFEAVKEVRASDVAVVHTGPDGRTVGGFTLRPLSGTGRG